MSEKEQKEHLDHLVVAAVRLCELLNADPYETVVDEYASDRLSPRWSQMMQVVEKAVRAFNETMPVDDEQRREAAVLAMMFVERSLSKTR